MTIRLCAFDAYGTLFDFNTVHRRLDRLGDKAAALRELWRTKQLQYMWQRNMLGEYADFETVTADALAVAMATLRIDDDDLRAELLGLYHDFQPYPEVRSALLALRALGLRLVVHTNATARVVGRSLASAGLAELFDDIVSIEAIGVYKPDPRAYRLLVERTGVAADHICFVSSNGWDSGGAAHFGLRVAWVNRAGTPPERLPGDIFAELISLGDLVPLLKG